MNCNYRCGKLCPNFVITTAVAFAGDTLTLTLPDNITYADGHKYCIVIGQTIPDTTTINAEVVAVVGTGTVDKVFIKRHKITRDIANNAK